MSAPARASSGPAPAIASLPRGPQAGPSAGGAAGVRTHERATVPYVCEDGPAMVLLDPRSALSFFTSRPRVSRRRSDPESYRSYAVLTVMILGICGHSLQRVQHGAPRYGAFGAQTTGSRSRVTSSSCSAVIFGISIRALPRSPHAPCKPSDRHRHARETTEPRRDVEDPLARVPQKERRRTFALRQVPPELRDVVAQPTGLVLPLFENSLLVRRRVTEPVRVRRRLQLAEERTRERLLERRRVPEDEVQVRNAARLILQDPEQKRRHPLVCPSLRAVAAGSQPSAPRSASRDAAPTRAAADPRRPSRERGSRAARSTRPPARASTSTCPTTTVPPCTSDALQHLRLGAVQLAVRVERRVDHRPERRRPGRPHRIAPSPTAVPPFTVDELPAAARTPLLVVRERVATDAHAVRDRPLERSQLLRRVDVHVLGPTPATGAGLTSTSDSCSEPSATLRRATGPPSSRGQPSPAAPPWVACDPTPRAAATRLRPRPAEAVANRPLSVRSRSHSCAGFLPA